MNHEQARQRWHDAADRGTPDTELEAHLDACPTCRSYVRDMESMMRVLDAVRRDTERVETGALRDAAGPQTAVRFPRWIRAAAMIAVVVGVTHVAFRLSTTTAPTARPPQVARRSATQSDQVPKTFGLTLRGASAEHTMVVVDPVSTADVQVYWLYRSLTQPAGDSKMHSGKPDDRQGRATPDKKRGIWRVSLNQEAIQRHES